MKETGTISKLISRTIAALVVLALGFAAGYVVKGITTADEHEHVVADSNQSRAEKGPTAWICSMHPQIRQPKPGKCSICLMDLIPELTADSDLGPRQISFSAEAIKLMELDTTPVERKFVTSEISRLDRLYVDFTGIKVAKGDHLVYLYSKELLEDQRALLAAIAGAANIRPDSSDFADRMKSANVEAVRTRLRLRGLTDEQIAKIEKAGEPLTHLTIYSPIGGVVIEKSAAEGMYVDVGTRIYTIADLSKLWVMLDVYESDLAWIRYGQEVEFATEAYPGEVFKGKVIFRDPVLNARTRTVKVRVNVDNADGRLKPEMFVRAVLRARVARGGAVMDPDLAGKWICPMHPSIVKDGHNICDICEMDLVTTESLFSAAGEPNEPPLVIPATAPLVTGKRAVVYVRVPDAEKPTFEGREIVLGPRAGDYYLVKAGLAEGDIVVTRGNFKIDSALQIQAKPSMMSAAGDHEHEVLEVSDEFRQQLWAIVEKYVPLQRALAGDDRQGSTATAGEVLESISAVDMGLVTGEAHDLWMASAARMKTASEKIKGAEGIEPMRRAFETLSNELIVVAGQFGIPQGNVLYRIHCPMAFDNKGADWLQLDEDVLNPYFGASMLKCGEVKEVIGNRIK
jgi:Cu(I)/Ag(I) efflux system membrane fusion protein